jgi:hypothetical protein
MTIENPPKPKHPDAEYKVPDRPGCDQEQHAARSAYHSPNHLKRHEKGFKEWQDSMTEGYDNLKEGEYI